jgi:peptidoglycan hydrolase-like protein with peptidoglycan-binding domain
VREMTALIVAGLITLAACAPRDGTAPGGDWTSPGRPSPQPTSPGESPWPHPPEGQAKLLTVGDVGDRVRELQRLLNRLGYDVTVDGIFGQDTEEAVIAFEMDVGLPGDGGWGDEEARAARRAIREQNQPNEEEPRDPAVLESGDQGRRVLQLQRRLEELRYWVGPKDGSFGTVTEQAVMALQGAAGLSRDGIVGPKTRRAIDEGVTPHPRSSRGDLIEIDEARGLLMVVRNGRTRWVFHTSTGTEQPYRHPDGNTYLADTPNGRWTFTWEVDGWRDGRLGRLWRPKYFHEDGIAIHGYPTVPAYPASHGCARVTMEAMNFIWESGLAPMGSVVLAYGRG